MPTPLIGKKQSGQESFTLSGQRVSDDEADPGDDQHGGHPRNRKFTLQITICELFYSILVFLEPSTLLIYNLTTECFKV